MAKFKTTEDVGGSSDLLKTLGIHHFVITEIRDGVLHNGKAENALSVDLSVLNDGNDKDKVFHLTLFYPDDAKSEKLVEWNIKKLSAFSVASNLISPAKLGEDFDVDEQLAVGHQILMELRPDDQNPEYLQLHYANIWHVDDPRAAKHPKNAASLAIIPAEFRHEKDAATYFEKVLGKRPGGNGSAKTTPAKTLTDGELDGL